MYEIITEGKVKMYAPKDDKVSKKLPVFYNPVMKLNRDISLLLLNALCKTKNIENMEIGLPLAGTGVRAMRFLAEGGHWVGSVYANDHSEEAYNLMKRNMELNFEDTDKIHLKCNDANKFLMDSMGFDYIDIDPFGSPNLFLENAIRRLNKGGVLAVTATDTSALAGTYPSACRRKYWAKPMRNELMHEVGIRILIRKVQLVASQLSKALTPVFCYSHQHYMRVFFVCQKGKMKVDDVLKKHKYLLYCECMERKISDYNFGVCDCGREMQYAGPMYTGELWDNDLVRGMLEQDKDSKLLNRIFEESEARGKIVGFYDIHVLAKVYKISIPGFDKLKDVVDPFARTHFSDTGIVTDMPIKELVKIVKNKK